MAIDTKDTFVQLDVGPPPRVSAKEMLALVNRAPQKGKKLVKKTIEAAKTMQCAESANSEEALKRRMAIASVEDAAEEMAATVIGNYVESILITMCAMAIGFTIDPETGKWMRTKPSMRACEYLLDRILGKRQAKDAGTFSSKVLVTVNVPPENGGGTEPRKVQGVVIDD